MAGHASATMTLEVHGQLWNHQLDDAADRMVEQMAKMRQAEPRTSNEKPEAVAQTRRAVFRIVRPKLLPKVLPK